MKPKFLSAHEIGPLVKAGSYRLVWYSLLSLYHFVVQNAAVLHYDLYRRATFVPFGGPQLWNRLTSLLIKEIEIANERHFGKHLDAEDRMGMEWQLSGYTREAILDGQRSFLTQYPPGPPDWGADVGDEQDTPFI